MEALVKVTFDALIREIGFPWQQSHEKLGNFLNLVTMATK